MFVVYMQGNSTVVNSGGNGNADIYREAQSTVTGTFSGVNTVCAAVNFPVLSCGAQSIDELLWKENCFISPNPADEEIRVRVNSEEIISGVFLNDVGLSIKEVTLDFIHKQATISVSDLPPGLYTLKLSSRLSGSISRRFVVAR